MNILSVTPRKDGKFLVALNWSIDRPGWDGYSKTLSKVMTKEALEALINKQRQEQNAEPPKRDYSLGEAP